MHALRAPHVAIGRIAVAVTVMARSPFAANSTSWPTKRVHMLRLMLNRPVPSLHTTAASVWSSVEEHDSNIPAPSVQQTEGCSLMFCLAPAARVYAYNSFKPEAASQ